MIDINMFFIYLSDICRQYSRTRNLVGISRKARKYGCTAITKSQFFEFGLNRCEVVTKEQAMEIRTLVSKTAKEQKVAKLNVERDNREVALPRGMEIVKLNMPSFPGWGYALRCSSVIDNAGSYMYARKLNADFVKELESSLHDKIDEVYMQNYTYICSDDELSVGAIYLVKMHNNGTCYWVHRCKDFLVHSALAAKAANEHNSKK